MRKLVFILMVILCSAFVSCNSSNDGNRDEKESISLFNLKKKLTFLPSSVIINTINEKFVIL